MFTLSLKVQCGVLPRVFPWTLQGQRYPMACACMCYMCPWDPNFSWSHCTCVSVTGHVETSATNNLNAAKWPWTLCQRYPMYLFNLLKCPWGPNFTALLQASCFRVGDHFEKSALNEPKISLNITRSTVPDTYVTSVLEWQISLCFTCLANSHC